MKRIFGFAVLAGIAAAAPASASDASPANPTSLFAMGSGAVLFSQSGSRTATPTCHTISQRWAIDASTPAGQARLSVLLTAFALHKQIAVHGAGICSVWPDTETVDYFYVID